LLEVKVDLIIFLSICTLNGESSSIGVCFSWNVSLLSTCSVLFQLPCTDHFVLGVTDLLWSSSPPFCVNLSKTYVEHLGSIKFLFLINSYSVRKEFISCCSFFARLHIIGPLYAYVGVSNGWLDITSLALVS
jgi:hypothetical protein